MIGAIGGIARSGVQAVQNWARSNPATAGAAGGVMLQGAADLLGTGFEQLFGGSGGDGDFVPAQGFVPEESDVWAAPQDGVGHASDIYAEMARTGGTDAEVLAVKTIKVAPTLPLETKDWLSRQVSAHGFHMSQLMNPHFLACAAVAQGVIPPPKEMMVPRAALDWLASSHHSEGSALGQKNESSMDRQIKWGLRVAIASRLGLAYLDRYQSRPVRRYTRGGRTSYPRTRSSSGYNYRAGARRYVRAAASGARRGRRR